MSNRRRVMLLVSSLEFGGAERQVINLANHLDPTRYEAIVCSLTDRVPLADQLQDRQRRLRVIPKHWRFDATVIPRLGRLLRTLNIDIVHAFLFDAEISARLSCTINRIFGNRIALIGSERNTDYRLRWHQTAARWLTKRSVDAVIANSDAGRRFQIQSMNAPPERVFVVRNGVDIEKFCPRKNGAPLAALNLDSDCPVVGMFCSFKRQKNHAMFFRMAKRLLDANPRTQFLCVGEHLHGGLQGSAAYRQEMLALASELHVVDSIRFLGNRTDMNQLYNVCDVVVLTSRREGTPNVVLEAMACGVPVVVTDVADNEFIVRDRHAGFVVPLDDDSLMAQRVGGLLQQPLLRKSIGEHARERAGQEFSLERLAANTAIVYDDVLAIKRHKRSR